MGRLAVVNNWIPALQSHNVKQIATAAFFNSLSRGNHYLIWKQTLLFVYFVVFQFVLFGWRVFKCLFENICFCTIKISGIQFVLCLVFFSAGISSKFASLSIKSVLQQVFLAKFSSPAQPRTFVTLHSVLFLPYQNEKLFENFLFPLTVYW